MFQEHIDNINDLIEYRAGFAEIDVIDCDEIPISVVIDNSWKLFKKTSAVLNSLMRYIVDETKESIEHNHSIKNKVEEIVIILNSILDGMGKSTESMESSLNSWSSGLKGDKCEITDSLIHFFCHKITYCYQNLLGVFDDQLKQLLELLITPLDIYTF